MSLVGHAQRELELAGLFDKDSDYEGAMGIAALDLVQVFAAQDHSGASAELVIDLFTKLAHYQNLTPITSNPKEWLDVSEMSGLKEGQTLHQSARNYALFSKDGGKTYYHVETPKVIEEAEHAS